MPSYTDTEPTTRGLWLREVITVTDDEGPHLTYRHGKPSHIEFIFFQLISAISIVSCLLALGIMAQRTKQMRFRGVSEYDVIAGIIMIHQLMDNLSWNMTFDPTSLEYRQSDDAHTPHQTYVASLFLHRYVTYVTIPHTTALVFIVTYVILMKKHFAAQRYVPHFSCLFCSLAICMAFVEFAKDKGSTARTLPDNYPRHTDLSKGRNIFRACGIVIQLICTVAASVKLLRSRRTQKRQTGGFQAGGTMQHQALVEVVRRFALWPISDAVLAFPLLWYNWDPITLRDDDYTLSAAQRRELNANDILGNSLPMLAGFVYSVTYFIQKPAARALLFSNIWRAAVFVKRCCSRAAVVTRDTLALAGRAEQSEAVEEGAAGGVMGVTEAAAASEADMNVLDDNELMDVYTQSAEAGMASHASEEREVEMGQPLSRTRGSIVQDVIPSPSFSSSDMVDNPMLPPSELADTETSGL